MLFVPAANPRHWRNAHTRGADAIILDLEDSTQPEAKSAARALAANALSTLLANGSVVTARVNNDPALLAADLEAVVAPGLRAIVMPKIDHPADLENLSARLDAIEGQRGIAPKAVGVVALIESPRALERLPAIADSPRVIGLALGGEDFALSLGRPPTPHALGFAAQAIAYSASARGLMGIGMTSGIADFSNLEAFAADAQRSRAMGLTGAMCIHPNQVPVLNACFGHSEAEITEARAILAAWQARVDGVVSHEGRMIDEPVAERARRILKRAGVA